MSAKKQRILVIEDDEISRHLLTFILEKAGFALEIANDGEQALKIIEKKSPADLILLDLLMPYHDGFEILDVLSKNLNWQQVPVIVLSGLHNEDDIQQSYEYDIVDFIHKPFDTSDIIKRIRKALSDETYE